MSNAVPTLMGLGQRPVSAVAIFFPDHKVAGLRFAQSRGVPHVSISWGIHEISPEVGAFMYRPDNAPVVLGAEWLVGAATVPALRFAEAFGRVDEILINALVDEEDTGGPTVAVDFERLEKTLPASLVRTNFSYLWLQGEDVKARFSAVDGTVIDASAFSSIDIVGLATATGAPDVRFNIATGVSSTRRGGGQMSTEIIVELSGEDRSGQRLRTRHAVIHSKGTAPLTGLGVSMMLERLSGLDGNPAVSPGLYFPHQILNADAYFKRLEASGGSVQTLDSPGS
ncbi:NAD(P)-dependent oxidoreductase [Pararhizobium sp. PWRC1-1]|uniref:NAD(P)-dependent oxidoreductase n=1 Tax=Pararhizobium sp. PWRC1-1 TaxID=2804566 RepID=UPI003CEF48B2